MICCGIIHMTRLEFEVTRPELVGMQHHSHDLPRVRDVTRSEFVGMQQHVHDSSRIRDLTRVEFVATTALFE